VITRAARRRTAVSTRGLPLALDLLSVCLSAGLPPAGAIGAVAAGLTGGLGSALAAVQRALALGAPAGQAWAPAVAATPALGRVADRFVQAERSGAALAPALAALAADERRSLQLARARAARRVGVLAAAPLGLCFLPAFVITGVLPIVGGLVHAMARS
jgi:pilus assembly protein TadC